MENPRFPPLHGQSRTQTIVFYRLKRGVGASVRLLTGRAAKWCLALAIVFAGGILLAPPAVAGKLVVTVIDGTDAVEGAEVVIKDKDGKEVGRGTTRRPAGGQGKPKVEIEVPDGDYTVESTYTDPAGKKKEGKTEDVRHAGPRTSVTVFVDPVKTGGQQPAQNRTMTGGGGSGDGSPPGLSNTEAMQLLLESDHPKHVLLPSGVDPEKVIKDFGLLAATYFALPDGAGGGTSLSCHADDAQWAKVEDAFCKDDPSACSTNSCKEWLFPAFDAPEPKQPTLLQRIRMHGASQVKIESKIVETNQSSANQVGISYKGGVRDGTGKPLAGSTVALMEPEPKLETALDDDPKNDPPWTTAGPVMVPVDKKGEFLIPSELIPTPYSAGDGKKDDEPKTGLQPDSVVPDVLVIPGTGWEVVAAVGWESTSAPLVPPGGIFMASTPKECEWVTVPRTDVPDFGGQVPGMATAADEKLPKPAPEKQACPEGQQGGFYQPEWRRSIAGAFTPISAAHAASHVPTSRPPAPPPGSPGTSPTATPPNTPESVTSAEGPLAGEQFGRLDTNDVLTPEGRAIKDIQNQMTQNGGRDTTLNEESWAKLQQQAEWAEANIRVCNREGFLFTMDGMTASLRKLQARLDELTTLRDRVSEGLEQQYDEMMETLDSAPQRDSTLKKGVKLTAEGVAIYEMIQFLRHGHAPNPVSTAFSLYGIYSCVRDTTLWINVNTAMKYQLPRVMDRAEKAGDLTLLIAQYEHRLEAQRELINQLSNAFDEHACKKCVGGDGQSADTGTRTRGPAASGAGTGTGTGTGAGTGAGAGTGGVTSADGTPPPPRRSGVTSADGTPPPPRKPGVTVSGGRPR
jgi:hypothetical protein